MSQGSVDGCVDMDGLDRKGRQLLQVSGGSLFPAQVLVPVWTCSRLNAGISKFSSSPGENFQGFTGCSRPLSSKKDIFWGTFFPGSVRICPNFASEFYQNRRTWIHPLSDHLFAQRVRKPMLMVSVLDCPGWSWSSRADPRVVQRGSSQWEEVQKWWNLRRKCGPTKTTTAFRVR